MPAFGQLLRRVEEWLGQRHRYAHSVRVARCADLLAQRHGADPRQARLAGLLHDLARLYSPERLVAEAESRGLRIGAGERAHPVLLHAPLGAAIARERFGVDDPQVLSAIEKHTTGARDMSTLDRIVYLADSLEPHRAFPERAAFWQLASTDLQSAMRAVLKATIEHYTRKGLAPAPATLEAAAAFGVPLTERPPEVRTSAS